MSVRASDRVWSHSKRTGSELLMLLAIADFADDAGNAFPSVPTLAAKCRMTTRNVNHILVVLQDCGELEVRRNAGPRGTNLYRITLCPSAQSAVPLAPEADFTPEVHFSPEAGFTPEACFTLKPVSHTPEAGFPKPLKPASDEPSLNRQEPSVGTRARKSKTAAPRTLLPTDFGISDQVRAWAISKGYGRLEEHLEAFKLKAEAKGYVYSDWDAALKTAIRDDWAGQRKSGTDASPARQACRDTDYDFATEVGQ